MDVRIPGALSFLAYNTFTGEVKGINELQEQFTAQYGPGKLHTKCVYELLELQDHGGAWILDGIAGCCRVDCMVTPKI